MKITALPIALALALMSGAAMAAPTYCSAGNTDGLSVSDMTFKGNNANNCYGVVAGNDKADDINDLALFGASDWVELGKYNNGEGSSGGDDPLGLGIDFELVYIGLNAITGLHEYNLKADATPDSLLPALIDLIGVVKQGNDKKDGGWAAYFFDNASINEGGNLGTFYTAFGPGENDFSHITFYGTNYDQPVRPPQEIPEPGALALAGLALFGLAAVRRRRPA